MNFDKIASQYDFLAKIIFGDKWRNIQLSILEYFPEECNILIVGGGTGIILDHTESLIGRKITFLDKSERMIELARQREFISEVEFINEDLLMWQGDHKYDLIVCPFFLDCFDQENLALAIRKLKQHLTIDGNLLVLDFQPSSIWRNLLVGIMYIFFRLFVGLQGRRLLNIKAQLIEEKLKTISYNEYLTGWIFRGLYQLCK